MLADTPIEPAARLDPAAWLDGLLADDTAPLGPSELRSCPPAETVARCRAIAPQVGISRVADVTGLDRIGVPVVMVVRPDSRSLSVSQGKGLTLDAATASGMMESIEAFHAERVAGPLLWGSRTELSTRHRMLDAAALPRLTSSLYADDKPILWVETVDLFSGQPVWAPLETVSLDFSYPHPPSFGCYPMTSNGLASGNTPTEAVLHALFEVVERDALARWADASPAHQAATRIALDSIDDPVSVELLERLAWAGHVAAVRDLTSDIGLPAFSCTIIERSGGWPCDGMGCHADRDAALRRAILEAIQTRVTYIAGSRDDLEPGNYRPRFSAAADVAHLAQPGTRPFAAVPSVEASTLGQCLRLVLDRLAAAGISQVGLVDLSIEDVGVPVARVVAPGLAGPREGFGTDIEYLPLPRRPGAQP